MIRAIKAIYNGLLGFFRLTCYRDNMDSEIVLLSLENVANAL